MEDAPPADTAPVALAPAGAPLPPPATGRPDLLVVAGEHSGDEHAGRLLAEVRAAKPDLRAAALGGEQLAAAGAQLLFDLTAHSVVGFAEVVRNYGFFKRLFEKVVDWVVEHRPRVVCLVDYPGFNLRLAARLAAEGISRKGGGETAVFYYIAPQVWAWKAKRRFAMAEVLDGLGVIFPFEVGCFADTGLPTEFVGHPFVSPGHRPPVAFAADGPLLLLPGSRRAAVGRIFPAMAAGFEHFLEGGGEGRATVIYPSPQIRSVLEASLAGRPALAGRIDLVPGDAAGTEAVAARAVLTSSGTMSLSCALAGIPGAIAYRAHPLTYLWAKRLIRVPHLGIANLLLEWTLYPEFIQGRASPAALARALAGAAGDPARAQEAAAAAAELRGLLGGGGEVSPGAWLLKVAGFS